MSFWFVFRGEDVEWKVVSGKGDFQDTNTSTIRFEEWNCVQYIAYGANCSCNCQNNL